MAITISGSVTVQDNQGQQYTINADEMEFDDVSRVQQAQGTCTTHEGYWEDGDWSVTVSVEEYPNDAYNGHEVTPKNCIVIHDNIECSNGGVEDQD